MSLTEPKILVVEDEPSQVELLRYNLQSEGFEVIVATDGEAGVERARDEQPDVILLDWMLPKTTGIEACRQLRRMKSTRHTPIIMLTARSEERDKVRGLDIGADDYLTKPYSIKELMARVRAVMRRSHGHSGDDILRLGVLEVDLSRHRVQVGENPVHLGPTEFRLLTTLMNSPSRVFSRGQLLDMVWGLSSDIDTRTVDVHIGRLRRLMANAGEKSIIRTVRGYGYSIEAP